MLVQHLLTERLIRTIFSDPNFTRRNAIAIEVETVIDALVSKAFNREEFLKSLDRFYLAIESAARTIESFADKQHFLNVVYERFFQGYSVKIADTHGIVYTPQPIVDFMCNSVADILDHEFGLMLGDERINILDPCTGTGNYIVNIVRRIPYDVLARMYHQQLFANEVMLMPYYIASLNIEHAYYERRGEYEPFEGLCFVDTLDLADSTEPRFGFLTEANTERVERQKSAPITVIIGNPPYNIGQLSENDNNKNRAYKTIDRRIQKTYGARSGATLTNKLYDPYVKFFRWATDRLQDRDGVVCYISNNSFVDQIAFDGMRSCLGGDFSRIYHIDLLGNVRHDPKLSGTAYNVFGIQVGVGITMAVKNKKHQKVKIRYFAVPRKWRREEKLKWLAATQTYSRVKWKEIVADERSNWIKLAGDEEFSTLVAIGSREAKAAATEAKQETIFKRYSLGVSTNRDSVVYEFHREALAERVKRFTEDYNAEVDRWRRHRKEVKRVDEFLDVSKVKWSSTLKQYLLREQYAEYDRRKVRVSLYRPFTKQYIYYDHLFVDRPGLFANVLPNEMTESENRAICAPTVGNRGHWSVMAVNVMPNLNLTSIDAFQCFPFYLYGKDGTGRNENVTNWALDLFRKRYRSKSITKWDIFYYVYAVLFHAGYREKFEKNLRRELPRIPLCESADDFAKFSDAGNALMRLHIDYETAEPWPLKRLERPGRRPSSGVEKMRLSGDRKSLVVNDSLTLGQIPAEVFEYRLGNRSALEWVIDQYQVNRDERGEIVDDPNRAEDAEYIVRLVGQVVRVSVETIRIVQALPASFGGGC
jgi:predicted helicase